MPLDDRPSSIYFPQQVGKASGVRILLPPAELLGRFRQPGNGKKIGDWLLAHAQEADGYVISASMVGYGGLVASRTSETTLEQSLNNLEIIRKLKERSPDKPVFVYDTIQRLAVTATGGETLKHYENVREWAILHDLAGMANKPEYRAKLAELEKKIPPHILKDYVQARQRNQQIHQRLLLFARLGFIDYLVFAQDDASPYGIHREEREKIRQTVEQWGLGDKVAVFPGTDEVAVVLISRFVQQTTGHTPSFYVEYSGTHGKSWIAPFEDIPFAQNVEKHIAAAGGVLASSPEEADIRLFIHTPVPETERQRKIDAFVQKIKDAMERGQRVAIVDVAFTNRGDPDFIVNLARNVDLTQLLSYSGWNTAGNALGIAVAHAAGRHALLEHAHYPDFVYEGAAQAHVEFLFHRFADDYIYKNIVLPKAKAEAKKIGADIYDLAGHSARIDRFVAAELASGARKWYPFFEGKTLYTGAPDEKKASVTIGPLQDLRIGLPWQRLFEVQIEPTISLR
ncbi:DUF4127 family protein [Bacillaceae bacterium]